MSLLDEADRLIRQGEPHSALELLRSSQAEKAEPPGRRYAELLSLALLRTRQYEQSASTARRYLDGGLDSELLHDVLSEALVNLGLVHEAHAQDRLGSGSSSVLTSKAWVALYKHDPSKAEELARQALDKSPSPNATCVLWAARAFMGHEGAFDRLLALWQNDGLAIAFNAIVLYSERRPETPSIEDIVEQATHWPKADTQFFYWIARFYLKLGEPEKALRALDDAPSKIRGEPRMDLFRGMALYAQHRFTKALPLLQRAFEDQPAGVDEERYYFMALIRTGRLIQLVRSIVTAWRSKIKLLPSSKR